ncbi:MAG: FMN-binding protein [Myxococcota bacterium]|jgi:Na+-translocating ferredoxin:NAD+ oxidoreductase RnfG subunit|nr:FMN-binding protein [Myxococcota bacterium]
MMTKPLYSCLTAVLILLSVDAQAKVYHSRQSALREAFPDATRIEDLHLYLSAQDQEWIQKEAGTELKEHLAHTYIGYKNDQVLGYAFIDTHQVRSAHETLMIVISPSAQIAKTFVLAFHEPNEYKPHGRWLKQFTGKALQNRLALQGDIDTISGATMTARAVTHSTRRILALFLRKVATTS